MDDDFINIELVYNELRQLACGIFELGLEINAENEIVRFIPLPEDEANSSSIQIKYSDVDKLEQKIRELSPYVYFGKVSKPLEFHAKLIAVARVMSNSVSRLYEGHVYYAAQLYSKGNKIHLSGYNPTVEVLNELAFAYFQVRDISSVKIYNVVCNGVVLYCHTIFNKKNIKVRGFRARDRNQTVYYVVQRVIPPDELPPSLPDLRAEWLNKHHTECFAYTNAYQFQRALVSCGIDKLSYWSHEKESQIDGDAVVAKLTWYADFDSLKNIVAIDKPFYEIKDSEQFD